MPITNQMNNGSVNMDTDYVPNETESSDSSNLALLHGLD